MWGEALQAQGMDSPPIKVFAHLAHGQDPVDWERMWTSGRLVGICERTPYGYGRANDMGCSVTFSVKERSGPIGQLLRIAFRAVFGFDYFHARHNAKQALASDIVWTHTESQYLAMALVFALAGKKRPLPKLLGQSVWFFDKWSRLDPFRKALYRRLIAYVDCLTVHSPLNLEMARRLFPDHRCELVRFGIATEELRAPVLRANQPHRIVCLGNDRHRDWKTAIEAFANLPGVEVKIFSTQASAALLRGAKNVEIRGIRNNEELIEELAKASMMVLPLKPNLHASGATALQEAVIFGVPVIVSDTGGLSSYFGFDEVTFVPPLAPEALRKATLALLENPAEALAKAARAQAHIATGEIGAMAYVRDHVRLSREMLGLDNAPVAVLSEV